MIKKAALFLFPIILILVVINFKSGGDEKYLESAQTKRSEKIKFLKDSKESPFQQFKLKYHEPEFFPIDPKYQVRGNLEKIANPERISIQYSDGSTQQFARYAYAHFKIDGIPQKLLILKQAGFGALPNSFLTAFSDQTSGTETYGGGRYLDLEIGKSENITIDFNMAYNPYCAYVKDYSCPLPPAENILPIAIEAGEKDYQH